MRLFIYMLDSSIKESNEQGGLGMENYSFVHIFKNTIFHNLLALRDKTTRDHFYYAPIVVLVFFVVQQSEPRR